MRRNVLPILFLAAAISGPAQENREVLYQVSTLDALVRGAFDGETTLAELGRHGDFGIGTFNAVDGEMLLVDGLFYRIDGAGEVRLAGSKEKTPFAAVTFFETDFGGELDQGLDLAEACRRMDGLLPSPNLFYAVKCVGRFKSVKTRSVPRQEKPYRPLTDIVKTQPVFDFEDQVGMMVGFRIPEYARGLNFAGYHLHFLAKEGMGGGHVLGFVTDRVRVEMDRTDSFQLALPSDGTFLGLDLSPDGGAGVKAVEK